MTSTILELKELGCEYEKLVVVNNLSLHVRKGMFVCLLGPSGCGKTTVLRAIAGFEPITHGEIKLQDQIISKPGYTLPPEKRHLGMVFQDYALFPHMTVADNIGFGLRGMQRKEKNTVCEDLLQTVGLEGFEKRFPHELSGGQQQRVALARSLAAKPRLVLLDEPFSNLDIELRERLGQDVRDILKSQGITAVLVTHDQQEAFALGDMVGIMHQGKIVQWDTPFNLYHEPADRFVADFIGQGIFLNGRMLSPESVETELGIIQGDRAYPLQQGDKVDVLIRPDDIVPDMRSLLRGEIIQKAFKGAEIMYTLRLPTGSKLLSLFPSHYDHKIGEQVGIRVAADHLVIFPNR